MTMNFSKMDIKDLKKARGILENPGLAAKITYAVGRPLEKGFAYLPSGWNEKIVKDPVKALYLSL